MKALPIVLSIRLPNQKNLKKFI